jgi:hypothetical protein
MLCPRRSSRNEYVAIIISRDKATSFGGVTTGRAEPNKKSKSDVLHSTTAAKYASGAKGQQT